MFNPRELARIADAFGLGEPVGCSEPTLRGEQGRISRVETSTGTWAVKELFGPVSDRSVEEAAAFQAAAQAVGVPTPRLMTGPAGRVVLELGDIRVRVYEWVDLREPDPFLDPVRVGWVVADMHRIPFAGGAPLDRWYTDPVGGRRWGQLDRELTAAHAPFAAEFTSLRAEFLALEAHLRPPRNLQTCHRDLFADNLRVTVGGELCVIDWDDCGLADPVQELCLVLFEFNGGVTDVSRARTLYDAYVDSGGPARVSGPGDFSMVIAQLGHINERAAGRWLAASPADPERTRAESLLAESISYPLTCRLIDRIIEALSG